MGWMKFPNGLIAAATGTCIITPMSDLTHGLLACKVHLNYVHRK